ncbi:MAG: hypothetical protein R3360_02170 [Alphaproteobacteria bacterium]|nr:hypothetical protein [Alphaproteobacteria bacterium]
MEKHDHPIQEREDLEFIRVLEDLMDVLLDKGVITLDMLPPEAANKFIQRRSARAVDESIKAALRRQDLTAIEGGR